MTGNGAARTRRKHTTPVSAGLNPQWFDNVVAQTTGNDTKLLSGEERHGELSCL